ncbi:hypothetical protein [Niallia circulans]|uniref:hypothetical protein n=1 Tax=Niallia circulans TaxID=1397 RepID=UPI0026EE1C26|nr:hypothetical protein [Niallia circulans]
MSLIEHLEQMKYELLNHGLEMNEYKKYCEYVTVDDYQKLLENTLFIIENYIESQASNSEHLRKIGEILNIPFLK